MKNIKIKDHIVYNDEFHTYTNIKTNEKYKSVTTFIGSLKEKFEPTVSNTASTMKRLGMTYEEVLKHWSDINLESTIRGSKIHWFAECYLRGEIDTVEKYIELNFTELENTYQKDLEEIKTFIDTFKLRDKTLYVEDILWCDKLRLAGQSDLVIDNGDSISIMDWKTNQKTFEKMIKSYSKYKYMFDLPACSFNDYAIQLVIYGIFAERYYKKPVRKHTIVHIYEGCNYYVITEEKVKYIREQFLKQYE